MKMLPTFLASACAIAACGFGPGAIGATTKPGAQAKPVVDEVTLQEIPKAVFTIPASRKEGRNPFFPEVQSATPVLPNKTNAVDASAFVINGIAPRPPKPTVIINNRTFEPGEEGEVKVAGGGRVLIKCVEIKEDAAVIEVAKQRRELKVPMF